MSLNETQRVLRDSGIRKGPIERLGRHFLDHPSLSSSACPGWNTLGRAEGFWDANEYALNFFALGVHMEQDVGLIKAVNGEAEESRKILRKIVDEVRKMSNELQPVLIEETKKLRSNRMALVSEINLSLDALREVRRFFFEKDYEVEMDRLERFVRLCTELSAIKQSGILDAVCDSAIRLAVMEQDNERKSTQAGACNE